MPASNLSSLLRNLGRRLQHLLALLLGEVSKDGMGLAGDMTQRFGSVEVKPNHKSEGFHIPT